MAGIVPQPDHRLGQAVFVSEYAYACGGQHEIGKPRMLACEAPGGFTMPRQIDPWKSCVHVAEVDANETTDEHG